MPILELSFAIVLEDYTLSDLDRHAGPLFHRWLPDGEANALALITDDPAAQLTAWFARRGYVRDALVVFDYKRREVDPSIMERQAVLDAGPIMGRLVLSDVKPDQLETLDQDRQDDPEYVALGKRVVRLLFPCLSRLIRVLRINYGQYWLRELPLWDSRYESLGAYCGHLQLKWRADQQSEWRSFRPTKSEVRRTVVMPSESEYKQYLMREDFQQLPQVLASGYEPTLPAQALARAHQNYDTGAIAYALVEATTALELAIHSCIHSAFGSSKDLTKAVEVFWSLPIRAQLIVLMPMEAGLAIETLELALTAIDARNKIVHDGFQPEDDTRTRNAFDALLSVIARLLPGPHFKFPTSPHGNKLYASGE